MNTATINCVEYEYVAEPTDGVNLTTGEAWWGAAVKYRKEGARKWSRFILIDTHSWDSDAIHVAIDYQVNPVRCAGREPKAAALTIRCCLAGRVGRACVPACAISQEDIPF